MGLGFGFGFGLGLGSDPNLRVAREAAVLGLLRGAPLDLLVLRVLVRRAEEGAHVLERDARPLGEVALLHDEQLLRAVRVEPRLELQRIPAGVPVRGAGRGVRGAGTDEGSPLLLLGER